jgi:hypothetical protein
VATSSSVAFTVTLPFIGKNRFTESPTNTPFSDVSDSAEEI